MAEIRQGSVLKRNRQVAFQDIDNELVLLNLSSGVYYSTTGKVGCRIWELCDGSRTAGDIVSIISREFSEDSDTVTKDMSQFICDMINEGLLIEENQQ